MRRCAPLHAFLLAIVCATAVQAQTSDEIIARNMEAKGGAEKLKAVTSMRMTGTITLKGKELPIIIYTKRPNLSRQEIVLSETGPGGRVVQAFDGTTAWASNPMMGGGAQRLPPAASEVMKNSADFDSALIDYKAKGHTATLVGTEKLADQDVHHIRVQLKSGQVQHFFLDAKTGLEVKISQEMDGPTGKETLQTELSDYRPVDGLVMPHRVRQSLGTNTVAEIKIDKFELNAITDDGLFRMPKK